MRTQAIIRTRGDLVRPDDAALAILRLLRRLRIAIRRERAGNGNVLRDSGHERKRAGIIPERKARFGVLLDDRCSS